METLYMSQTTKNKLGLFLLLSSSTARSRQKQLQSSLAMHSGPSLRFHHSADKELLPNSSNSLRVDDLCTAVAGAFNVGTNAATKPPEIKVRIYLRLPKKEERNQCETTRNPPSFIFFFNGAKWLPRALQKNIINK